MPPKIIDLSKTDDLRDVVHLAVQALAEGRAVVFPTETDYVVAAAARRDGVAQIGNLAVARQDEPLLSLAVKSADEALDWAPRLTGVAQRIARRCWPGPVTMLVADDHPESLVHRLPADSRQAVVGDGRLRLRVPGHPLLRDCLKMLDGPVALAEPDPAGCGIAVTAQACVERCGDAVALVLDDGQTRYAQPSTTIAADAEGFQPVRPGVIADIAGVLRDQSISIESLLQRADPDDQGTAPVVVITHETSEGQVRAALAGLDRLNTVLEQPHLLAIENF